MATLGLEGKIYINTGTVQTPVWTEVCLAQDVTLSLEKSTADVTSRCASGWRQLLGTLREATPEFTILWDASDPGVQALKNTFFADNQPVEVLILDGDISVSGKEGLRATMDVTNFTRNEELEEGMTVDVTLVVAPGTTPAWVVTPIP